MNNDQNLGNMSEGEYRDLESAPLQNTSNNDDANDAQIPTSLNDDAVESDIDKDVFAADLDDTLPVDLDENLDTSTGFVEVLESDLGEEISDGGPSHNHIHAPEMDAPDTPGEIDIEDLDEDDLRGTGIPADALLDPLED